MKCQHCLKEYHTNSTNMNLGTDKTNEWVFIKDTCPAIFL